MVNFGPNPFSQNSAFQNAKQQTKPDTAFVSIEVPTNTVQIAGNLVGNTGGNDASFSLKVVLSGLSTQKPLTALESSIFLKNLLNLPQDIQALLLLLASPKGEEKPNSLKKLLEEIPELSLSLEEVQLVLGKESQEGISKLIKLLQTSRASFAGTETKPLEDLMKLTSQVNNRVNQSPMQALHTLLLLYLPPMVFPQNVQVSYEPPESEDKSTSDSTYHLTLFIETATLGKFKIDLGLHLSTQLIIAMEHDPIAQEILNRIESLFNQTLEKDGLPSTTIQFLLRPSRAEHSHSSLLLEDSSVDSTSSTSSKLSTEKPNKEGKASNAQKIAVFPTSGVSVIVVHSAFELAKIIFKLDAGKEAYTSV